MAKRFTETDKWKDDWFMSLNNDKRIVWLYLLDNCDHAGIWKPNEKLLQFICNTNNDLETIKEWLGNRCVVLENGRWFFPRFIKFQYPTGLNSNKPAVISVLKILKENNCLIMIMESLGNDYIIVKDKDKDKDKDKIINKERDESVREERENELETFLKVWREVFQTKKHSAIALKKNYEFWRKQYSAEEILEAIPKWKKTWLGSKNNKPETFLRQRNPQGEQVNYISEAINFQRQINPKIGLPSGFVIGEPSNEKSSSVL